MRAIILTYALVSEVERELLKSTKIFKLALNGHAEEYKPDARICGDYILSDLLPRFQEKIISVREIPRVTNSRVIKANVEFKGSTIVCAVEWLIKEGYTDILIIGDNKVNTPDFQEEVNWHINKLKNKARIYQYTKGNFMLPIRSVTEFIEEGGENE